MERPRCKTCPYWDIYDAPYPKNTHGEDIIDGDCHRRPPPPVAATAIPDTDGYEWYWPPTSSYDFCGEHPDFPAYITSLRESAQSTTPLS